MSRSRSFRLTWKFIAFLESFVTNRPRQQIPTARDRGPRASSPLALAVRRTFAMNAIIALCHFCEAHGTCILFCTQVILNLAAKVPRTLVCECVIGMVRCVLLGFSSVTRRPAPPRLRSAQPAGPSSQQTRARE